MAFAIGVFVFAVIAAFWALEADFVFTASARTFARKHHIFWTAWAISLRSASVGSRWWPIWIPWMPVALMP